MARILVVDYSRSGNTRKVAHAISRACGADLEQIRNARPRVAASGAVSISVGKR